MNNNIVEFVEFDEKEVLPTELDEKYMDFLNWLIAAMVNKRTSMQMTQREFASMVGISSVSMCRIETRVKTPSLETLFKMAVNLDIFQDFITSTELCPILSTLTNTCGNSQVITEHRTQ